MEVCPPKVVKCDECETARKDVKVMHHCPSCEQYLCEPCDKKMHGKGKRVAHERKAMATHTHFAPGTPPVAAHGGIPDSVTKCDECEGARDTVKVRCDACEQWLCEKCNTKLHKAGKRMAHVRKYFGGGSAPPVQGDKEVAPASVKACSECETPRADLEVICQCEPCEQWLCEPCDDKLHKKGKRMAHVRKHYNTKDAATPTNAPDLAPANATKCDECDAQRADLDNIIRCDACEQWLCPNCDEKMHKKGKRIAHERHAFITKTGAKPLAAKPKAEPPTPKSPARQPAQSNATLTRAVSKAKERDDEKHKDEEKSKVADDKAKKDAEEKAAEEKKRKEEERQKAAAEKERIEKERAEAEKAKTERERKLKEAEEKRARDKAALEEKKKKDEEELRLKIEQEAKEQLEREEAAREQARKEKAERKKARDDKRRIKAEKQAKKEAEEKAAAEKAEAERLLREKAEGELRAKLEAEARAKVEAEMRAKVEAEMRAKQEEEERQREKKERAEKKAAREKADAERKAKEEAERQERIRKEKEELDRKAEEERLRIEKEEKEAREQHEREEEEERQRELERQNAEAAAAERARNAAASPKRRPPTIAKAEGKKGGDKSASSRSVVSAGGGGEREDGFALGDFDGGPDDTPEPAPAAAAPDLGPEEDVNFLKKGLGATKHDTSFGKKTQKRDMWYEPGVNGGNLQWGRPGEKRVADKKKQLPMVAISEVYVGKSSASFKKIKEGVDACCFSLLSKERQLDLECASESDRDSFVRAIQHICKEHMITIQMHGAPKPRASSTSGKGKKPSVSGAGARAVSPSTAGARAVSPSNAKKPATLASKNTIVSDDAPPARAPPKKKAPSDKRTCDDCLDPAATLAVQCEECEQVLCADCDARIHKKGTRAAHARSPYVEGAGASAVADAAPAATKHVCQDCQDSANEVVCHCAECEQFLCHECDQRIHKKGTRSKHVRDYLTDAPAATNNSAEHSSTSSRDGALSPSKSTGKSESDSKEALGNQAFNNKKYDKAASYFTELINQNPSGYKYFLKRANCYFFLDKFKDALADANTALDLAPQAMEAYVMKGKSLDKLGKTEEAIQVVQDGLRIEPANIELKKALAKLKDEPSQPPPAEPAPATTTKGKGHVRQPSKPPPPPNKAPPSTAVSVFNPRSTVADWDGEKEDETQKKDKNEVGAVKAGVKAKLETGKKGPPPLPSGKAAGKKEPPPLKKLDKSKTEALERTLSPSKAAEKAPAKKEKEKVEEEAPPPAPEDDAPPPAVEGGDEWQEHTDPSTGNKYWHNTNSGETTWDDPHAKKDDEWGEAKDPSTGKSYWYNTKTGATTWENPHGSEWAESADPTTGKTFWYHVVTGQTTWDNPTEGGKKKEAAAASGPAIPTGMAVPKVVTVKNADWSEHKDAASGNVYYVNNKTQATTWSNPHQWNEWVDKSTGKKYWNNEVTNVTTWEYPK